MLNECEKLKKEREKVLKYLNKINNTKYNELLKAIKYHYYSKRYNENKNESRDDSWGIRIIKEFIQVKYNKFGKNDD